MDVLSSIVSIFSGFILASMWLCDKFPINQKVFCLWWLRPEFQTPAAKPVQQEVDVGIEVQETPVAVLAQRSPWPRVLPDQVRLVADVLKSSRVPLTEDEIAGHFTGRGPWKRRLPQIVETLVSLGRARRMEDARVLGAD